jgi:PAS domain S-box-containing protein
MTRHTEKFFEVSVELFVIVGPDMRIQRVNSSWTRVLGYREDELLGKPIGALQHPDDLARTAVEFETIRAGTPSPGFENRYRHRDGRYRWLRWSSTSDREEGLIYGAARDVTDERRATLEAREALARLEEAQRVAHVGSWEMDLLTGDRLYTREMFALHGMDPAVDEPWGMDELLERVIPEHRSRLVDAAARVRGRPGQVRVEYGMLAPLGRVFETLMETVRDAEGTPILLRGTTQDVTALRENERRLAAAEELAGMGSFEVALPDGELIWSPGTYRLYGRDADGPAMTRDDFYALMLPDEEARCRATVARAIAELGTFEIEYTIAGSDGRRIDMVSRGEAFQRAGATFLRGTIQDVTRQRRFTRQQQDIARLGQMALAGTDLRELFDEVCRVTTQSLDTTMASVLALQGDGSFAFAASLGFGQAATGTALPPGQSSIEHAALTATAPLVVHDWHTETRFPYPPHLAGSGVRYTAVLPIRGRDGPFGVLSTHSVLPGVLDADQSSAFLDALATFLATAIERLRHEAEIAGLASLRGRLVAENLEAEERARQRISEELHDGALQDLLAARQDLVEAAGDPDTRHEMLEYARQGVERAVRRLREAVHALHPVVLQHGGLEAAVQAAADQAARQGGFRPAVTVEAEAAGLRDELVMSLARELLTNAAKHAGADTVHVAVRRDDGAVVLEVADDGRGLDAEAVAAAPLNGHIGLASLVQRVEAVGGTLDLQAAEGRGTTVRARLPIG